ncbi:hypothetical protein FRC10_002479 [Ceratobasidium sp. 414]|nr:hypothetical protein FRC10_002479 [Ceratobasidium sp. 414]
MSTRKKNTRSSTRKQQPLSSYFPVKPKPSAVASPSKRLVRSSLTAHPVRSRKLPEDDDVLDLTRSTSPPEDDSDSPPSNKKQRVEVGPAEWQPHQSAHHSLFDNDMSPLTMTSSPAPSSHASRPTTPAKLNERVKAMAISPSPTPSVAYHGDSMMIDPNEIVESSQTQYIHLQFTPPSHRGRVADIQRVPAPVFTPPSHRSGVQNHATTSASRVAPEDSITPTPGPCDWHVPSSQGEVSEPRTPRKRSWAAINQSGTPSKALLAGGSTAVAPSSVASSSQGERGQMPPPMLPASVMRSSPGANNNASSPARLFPTGVRNRPVASPSSRLASLRARSARVHPSSDDRPDHVPSSQGELSLAPTELGTMESPQRPPAYPSVDTDLLTTIPSSNPASQEASANTSPRKHPPIPPVPRPDFAHPPQPRTPLRARVVHRGMTSSPTNLPSPRALFESLGLSTQGSAALSALAPTPTPQGVEKRPLDPKFAAPPGAGHRPIGQPQDSLERNNTSSQTIIPSSQPIHDSSPPPEYDVDAEVHSLNQAQMQHRSQLEYPHLRPSLDGSSQSLPPSQSPIKNSRVDPDRSAAGMNGVFGMLGFGSEADTRSNSFREAADSSQERAGIHTPVTHNLPPSSPPPETPPHHATRMAERESQFGTPGPMEKHKGSPLVLAFERARNRAKTTTPAKVRPGPASRAAPSSPSAPRNLDSQVQILDSQTQESIVEDSQPRPKRRVTSASKNKAHNRSQSVGVLPGGPGPTRPKRTPRALRPTTPSQRTPLSNHEKGMEVDYVCSSDAEEEAMELEARAPLLDVATSPVRGPTGRPIISNLKTPSRAKGKGKENANIPITPSREERLPSSASPSPITIRVAPVPSRYSSPSPLTMEDTQTQDETETPWETLRPSQSVSQVLERRILEEAMEEAERGRVLRIEQEAQRERERVEEVRRKEREAKEADMKAKAEAERVAEEAQTKSETDSPDKAALKLPSQGMSRQAVVPAMVSTPKSRRVMGREIYVVTPTKIVKRTPVKPHRDRAATMTPSSPLREDEGDEEYTYVDETFNPTASQMSFLNRIMNASSEAE